MFDTFTTRCEIQSPTSVLGQFKNTYFFNICINYHAFSYFDELFCNKNIVKAYFDKRLGCAAPNCWSRYTTIVISLVFLRASLPLTRMRRNPPLDFLPIILTTKILPVILSTKSLEKYQDLSLKWDAQAKCSDLSTTTLRR